MTCRSSRGSLEGDVVVDDSARGDGYLPRLLEVEPDELDPVLPDLPHQLLDELDGQLLAPTAAVAEPERGVAGRVAHRVRRVVDHAVDGAERAVGELRPAAIAHGERCRRGRGGGPAPPPGSRPRGFRAPPGPPVAVRGGIPPGRP